MVEHTADVLSPHEVGVGCRTGYEIMKGKSYSQEIVEFGGRAHFECPKASRRHEEQVEGKRFFFLGTRRGGDCWGARGGGERRPSGAWGLTGGRMQKVLLVAGRGSVELEPRCQCSARISHRSAAALWGRERFTLARRISTGCSCAGRVSSPKASGSGCSGALASGSG